MNLSSNPFPNRIPQTAGIVVEITDFARLPHSWTPDSQEPAWLAKQRARIMLLIDEPGSCRLFVNDMRGPLYSVSYDGRRVDLYLDLAAPRWNLDVDFSRGQNGFEYFAFHPQFGLPGASGSGKFYTILETSNTARRGPDFTPVGGKEYVFDTILLEWTARDPLAASYDGGPPRELLRVRQPTQLHNGGQLGFNPHASPGDTDFGILYVSLGDGGEGLRKRPHGHVENPAFIYGSILRIDPLGSNSANGRYGIPEDNPFVEREDALGEIHAYGLRHPQNFGWDARTGDLYVTDIGEHVIEEISVATPGANLGWSTWEGSFRVQPVEGGSAVSLDDPRSDPGITYPIVEFDHEDPLLRSDASAITGVVAYRDEAIPPLQDKLLFGDIVSGQVFYVDLDGAHGGGQDGIRRVLFRHEGGTTALVTLIGQTLKSEGLRTDRADLRFGTGPDGQVFVLNKVDGVIRRLGSAPFSACACPAC